MTINVNTEAEIFDVDEDSMNPVNDTINDKYAPGVNHTQLKIVYNKLKIV